eukprot:5493686-Amphidinium_carterae.1
MRVQVLLRVSTSNAREMATLLIADAKRTEKRAQPPQMKVKVHEDVVHLLLVLLYFRRPLLAMPNTKWQSMRQGLTPPGS